MPRETVDVLRKRFPLISSSATDDICYATTNRQQAVKAIAEDTDLVLVLGSPNSSNSLRLVEVAERAGTEAHLIDDATEILPEWLAGSSRIGITAGASAPPHLVDEVIGTLQALGPVEVNERVHTTEEIDVHAPERGHPLMAIPTPARHPHRLVPVQPEGAPAGEVPADRRARAVVRLQPEVQRLRQDPAAA